MKIIPSARLAHLDQQERIASSMDAIVPLNQSTFDEWLAVEHELESAHEAFYDIHSPSPVFHANFFRHIAVLENKQRILRTLAAHMGDLIVAACEAATLEASNRYEN